MRAIIVEDEIKNQKYLKSLLEGFPEIEILECYTGVSSALKGIANLSPDLLFLDIQLDDGTGFDLLERLEQVPHIIFTTAFDQYAIQAFKFSAVDYLLKPIDEEELSEAISKIPKQRVDGMEEKIARAVANYKTKNEDPFITIAAVSEVTYVKVSNVIRLEGQGAYCNIYCDSGKKYLLSKTLKEFEALLEVYSFLRVHQSHIINLNRIASYSKGDHSLTLNNGDIIPISRNRKEGFLKAMTRISL